MTDPTSPTRVKSLYIDGKSIHNKDRDISCLLVRDSSSGGVYGGGETGKNRTTCLRFVVAARNYTAVTTGAKPPRKLERGTITAAWNVRGDENWKFAGRTDGKGEDGDHEHSPDARATSQPFSFIDLDIRSIRAVRAVSSERKKSGGGKNAKTRGNEDSKLRGSASVIVEVSPGTKTKALEDEMIEVRDGFKVVFFSVKNAMTEKDRLIREIEELREGRVEVQQQQQQQDEEVEGEQFAEPTILSKRSRKCSSSGFVRLLDADEIVDEVQSSNNDGSMAAEADGTKYKQPRNNDQFATTAERHPFLSTQNHGPETKEKDIERRDSQLIQESQQASQTLSVSQVPLPCFTQKEPTTAFDHSDDSKMDAPPATMGNGHVVSSSFFSSSPAPEEQASLHLHSIHREKPKYAQEFGRYPGSDHEQNDDSYNDKAMNDLLEVAPDPLSNTNNDTLRIDERQIWQATDDSPKTASDTVESSIKQRLRGRSSGTQQSNLQPAQHSGVSGRAHPHQSKQDQRDMDQLDIQDSSPNRHSTQSQDAPTRPSEKGEDGSCDRHSGVRQNRRGDAGINTSHNAATTATIQETERDASGTRDDNCPSNHPGVSEVKKPVEESVECIPDSQGLLSSLQAPPPPDQGVQGVIDNPALNLEKENHLDPTPITPVFQSRKAAYRAILHDISMAEKNNTNINTAGSGALDASATNGGKLKRPSHKLAFPNTLTATARDRREATNWDLDAFGDDTEPGTQPKQGNAAATRTAPPPPPSSSSTTKAEATAKTQQQKKNDSGNHPVLTKPSAEADITSTEKQNDKPTPAAVGGAKRGRGRPRGSTNRRGRGVGVGRTGRTGRGGRGGRGAGAAGVVLPLTPITATTEKAEQKKDGGTTGASTTASNKTNDYDSAAAQKTTGCVAAASPTDDPAAQRGRRGAAERAIKEITKEKELENAKDDPDDPIESSVPEDKHLRAAAANDAKKLEVTNDYENEADGNDDDDSEQAGESDGMYDLTPHSPKRNNEKNQGNDTAAAAGEKQQTKPATTSKEETMDNKEVICISDSETEKAQENKAIDQPIPAPPAQPPSPDVSLADSPLSPLTASRSTASKSGLGKRLTESLYNSGLFTTSSGSSSQLTSPSSVEDNLPTANLGKNDPETKKVPSSSYLTKGKEEKGKDTKQYAPKQHPVYEANHNQELYDGETTLVNDEAPATAPSAQGKASSIHLHSAPKSILSTTKKARQRKQERNDDRDDITAKEQPPAARNDEDLQKKVQVVSFDTSGPRNQGTVSAKRKQQQQQRLARVGDGSHTSATKDKAQMPMSALFSHSQQQLHAGRMQSQVDENGSPMPVGTRRRDGERERDGDAGRQEDHGVDANSENDAADENVDDSDSGSAPVSVSSDDDYESDASRSSFRGRLCRENPNPFAMDAIPPAKGKNTTAPGGASTSASRSAPAPSSASASAAMAKNQENNPSSWRHNGKHIHVERTKSGMPIFVTSSIAKQQSKSDYCLKNQNKDKSKRKRRDASIVSEVSTEEETAMSESDNDEQDNEEDDGTATVASDFDSATTTTTTTTSAVPGDSMEDVEDAEATWKSALRKSHITTLDIMTDINQRLMRHLVSEESAIADIVATYDVGCSKLIKRVIETHDGYLDKYSANIDPIIEHLAAKYEDLRRRLVNANSNANGDDKGVSMRKLKSALGKRKRVHAMIEDAAAAYARGG